MRAVMLPVNSQMAFSFAGWMFSRSSRGFRIPPCKAHCGCRAAGLFPSR